jgi:Flp pilus assembly protein CpaB
LAQTQGRLQLVLRNANDAEVSKTTGVRENDLFGPAVKTINVSRPAPRQVVAPVAPPPPPVEVEVFRGNSVSRQTFESAQVLN